jgi:MFS family permease
MGHTASTTAQPTRFIGWLSLAQLISWGSVFYTFALIMEPVERSLSLSRSESSLAFSLALMAEGLLAFPVGRWIDQGHERSVMTAGSVLLGLCLLAHGAVQTQAQFYGVWIGLGMGMAATLYAPVFAVVIRRFPNDFRRGITTMTFLGGLASTVFIPLTSWLIASLGWRHALWCLAALHLLVCAPLHAVLLRQAPTGAGLPEPARGSAAPSLSQHLLSAPFLLIGVFVCLMMAVTVAVPAHLVSLLRENGLSPAWVVTVPASIGALQVLGRLVLYFWERHLNLHLANIVISGLIPLSLVVLLLAPVWPGIQVAVMLLFVLLYGVGNGMLTIVRGTVIAEYVSQTHVASLNGALGIPLAVARSAAPLALGLMWQPVAGYTAGLWLLLGLSAAGVVALTLAQHLARAR